MSEARSEVGTLVRVLRERHNLTQEALAHKIGCSKAQLSLMESGQRTITAERAQRLEAALDVRDGQIVSALQWQHVPASIRAQVEQSQTQTHALASRLKRALASENALDELRLLVQENSSNVDAPLPLRNFRGIPVVNNVAAGYPTEFTDLDYPAAVADEYIACPDVNDPDAFAARVVGDSMEPDYREGDIVVFAPQLPTPSGTDCFVRLERDNQTTFKRIYIEEDGRTIRLQPLNNAYTPQFIDREAIGGMYAASYVLRRVRA
jgi:phage repressor protein C with HTH and peptisase S24 domain/DNA-binding XRE family transcriptional regulator